MNPSQQRTANRAKRIGLKVRDDLGLHDWHIKWEYHTQLEGSETHSSETGMDATQTSFITKALWQYRQVTFHVYLPPCATATDEELYFTWVHEWVHVMMSSCLPYRKSGTASDLADEWATETISRALMIALGKPFPE